MRLAWLLVVALLWATPAAACSLFWPGYEQTTRDSDVVALVRVEAATPGERQPGRGKSLYGVATATVLTGLKGATADAPLSFEHRMTDSDFVCDYDIVVEPGQQYWVWLDRGSEGLRTRMAVSNDTLSWRDRRAIRAGTRSR